MTKHNDLMREIMSVCRALSDENRLRAFAVLRNGELCVCQITELLGLAPSTVSKHMSVLKQAGLVERRKQGRWIYYRHVSYSKNSPQKGLVSWLLNQLTADRQTAGDLKTIKTIIKMDPELLCKNQCQK